MTESIAPDRSYAEIFDEETRIHTIAIEDVLEMYRTYFGATDVEIEYIKAATAASGIEQRLKHGVSRGQPSDSKDQIAQLEVQKTRLVNYERHLRTQVINPDGNSLPWHYPVASLLNNVQSLAKKRSHSFNPHRTQVIASQDFLPTFQFENA